jgi:hypothetical protein
MSVLLVIDAIQREVDDSKDHQGLLEVGVDVVERRWITDTDAEREPAGVSLGHG